MQSLLAQIQQPLQQQPTHDSDARMHAANQRIKQLEAEVQRLRAVSKENKQLTI